MTDPEKTMDPSIRQEGTMLDIAIVLAENARTLVFVSLGAGLIAFVVAFFIPPSFIATARILPPGQQQSPSSLVTAQLGALAGLIGGAAIKSPADQYTGLLKSRTIADALVQRFNLKELYRKRYAEDAVKELAERTRITAGPKDGLISIQVEDEDSKRAAEIANAYVDELTRLTNTLAVSESAQRRLFFETQLKHARDGLARAETALRGSGVSEATLRTVPQAALETLARLKAQITAQEVKLASMRAFMTESNSEFQLALQQLAALRSALATAEQTSPQKAAGEGAEYIAKFRDFKYHETLFELMAKQFELARLDEAREGAVIQVVDKAQPPERKFKPKKAVIAIVTTIATLIIAAVFFLIRDGVRKAASDQAYAAKLQHFANLVRRRRA